ncbi:MAG: BolA family transcriptional regulator [Bacteriovoracaceae bacterium]|jgi:stress-induced morphogen|nr:BolA family transcriptional regulator [Bacteriovoracaceae bacterium]
MNLFTEIEELIINQIDDAKVTIHDLTGTGDHLGLTVISDRFDGKGLLDQHQMIMDILKEKFKENLHAVQIKTMTYQKAKDRNLLGE